jgi:D-glycero-alpha-D-manno-heptose-7-phosphate kinase
MIYATCPLRVSLCGGGSDLPDISKKLKGNGCTIGFSSNLNMTVVGHTFINKLILKYSEIEEVQELKDIKHSIYKEVLKREDPLIKNYQIVSMCDVTGGTGLGSSSSFTVALLALLYKKLKKKISTEKISMLAAIAEIEWCGNNIGLQDQFLGSLGGLNMIKFNGMSRPKIDKMEYPDTWGIKHQSPFLLFKISGTHSSSEQLKYAEDNINKTQIIRDLVPSLEKAIKNDDIPEIAKIVGENWKLKKLSSPNNNIPLVDEVLRIAKSVDPLTNGKLLGSGGGGFFLLISENANKIQNKLGKDCIPIWIEANGLTVKDTTLSKND